MSKRQQIVIGSGNDLVPACLTPVDPFTNMD